MGLFASRPEEHDEWALPSEPVERDETDLLPETTVPTIDLNPVSASASWVSFSTESLTTSEDSAEESAEDSADQS